jgi:Uncharacterized ACR, COG1430
MREGWLLRDGQVLASMERPDLLAECVHFVLAREVSNVVVAPGWCAAHTLRRSCAMDVAFLDGRSTVMALVRLPRRRIALPRLRAHFVLSAPAGSIERWQLQIGDCVELRDVA